MSGIATAIGNWLGLRSKELDLRNAPDMKAAAEAQDEAAARDKTNAAIGRRDVEELRRELAE